MRFIPNPDFEREIERQVEFRKSKILRAEKAKEFAVSIAPVGDKRQYSEQRRESSDPDMKPGAYKKALQEKGVHVEGTRVYLRSTDWKGHWVEWGSINNRPAHAVLRRAVIAVGLKLREDPKGQTRRTRKTSFTPIKGFESATLRNVPE